MKNATSSMLIRIEPQLKAKAAKAFDSMGMSTSVAVKMFLTRVVADQQMPFEVRVPNAKTKAAMREARRGASKAFGSVREMMADLNADD